MKTAATLLVSLVLCAPPASAQVSVEVSPLRVEVDAAAGSTTTQAITVRNYGKKPIRMRATLVDWDLSRDGTPQFEGARQNGPFSATAWVRLAPPEQVIDPEKEAIVRFSLTAPADVPPGGYRTSVLFDFSSAEADALAPARAVAFKGRVATMLYVNIGQPAGSAELVDVAVRSLEGETQVVAVLRNGGRRSLRTKGTLVVLSGDGQPVREVPLPDVPVLPESEREVAIAVGGPETAPLPAGEYRVELKIDLGLPALLIGEASLKVAR
jgi:hypothetical protein